MAIKNKGKNVTKMESNNDLDLRPNTPLLLLPGLICDARIFARQVASIPEAIAFDGYDGCDDLRKMAERVLQTAPRYFNLLGHSMGARIALEIVRAAPERVARLALISTGVHPIRQGEVQKRYALRAIGQRDGMAALVDAWLPPMFGPAHREDKAMVSMARDMCISAGLRTFELQINALLTRPEVESTLPAIRCPTLIAVGADDQWSPPVQHKEIAAQIPNAQLVIIPRAGHMLPLEAPEQLTAAIEQWLQTPIR
jgi:pimeloyl-ACP methyl ester carboxylesterase